MSFSQAAPAKVPAWKRLGLKLKGAAGDERPAAPHTQAASAPQRAAAAVTQPNGSWDTSNKRKQFPLPSHSTSDPAGSFKRPRLDQASSSPHLRRQKSVTFSDDTKAADAGQEANASKKKKKPKKRSKGVNQNGASTPAKEPHLQPSLEYLRLWKSARDAWKFNKNHQTLLIKYVFTKDAIPTDDTDTFYLYIRDIKGAVRSRFRESAEAVRKSDMEKKGAAGFGAETLPDADAKQTEYDQIMTDIIEQRSAGETVNANGKRMRRISEVEYTLRTSDPEVRSRLMRRIRAENILAELSESDSDESTTSAATSGGAETESTSTGGVAGALTDKRVKLNDGTQQRVKRRRKGKDRSGMLDDDDESSDDSDNDDDDSTSGESDEDATSSSGASESSTSDSSESEEDSDEEMPNAPVDYETSSSSSSSSSSSATASEADDDSSAEDDDSEDE